MRTYVYVDGFNLYYGALKGTPFKWLNVVELAKQLVPSTHTVDKLKYFTARVSGAVDPQTPVRQHAYLLALSTLPNVEIYYGRFLSKNIWRPNNKSAGGRRDHTFAGASCSGAAAVNLRGGRLQSTGWVTHCAGNTTSRVLSSQRRRAKKENNGTCL